MNDLEQIIEGAGTFALLLEKNPEEYELLGSRALERTIASKNFPVINLPLPPEDFGQKWSPLLKTIETTEFPQKTSIKLPKEKYGIKKIGYKDEQENISLIITSRDNSFSKEDFVLEKLPPEPDVAFCFSENKEFLKNFENSIHLPERRKLIFIAPDEKTVAEKVFDICRMFNADIFENKKELTSLLFASLLIETVNFSRNTNEGIFALASSLLQKGANQQVVEQIQEQDRKLTRAQLLGRILARTYYDENTETSWSFLTNRDLQKTNNIGVSAAFLNRLITNKVKTFIHARNFHILLWQTQEGIKALVSLLGNREGAYYELRALAERTGGIMQSKFFTLGPFENFSRAEIYLRNQIKEIKPV